MTLSRWAHRRDPKVDRAKQALATLPPSLTKAGQKAVPFPFGDKHAYKSKHSNREIRRGIEQAPIEDVPLEELHSIQHSVQPAMVSYYLDHPDYPPPSTRSPEHGGLVDLPVVVHQDGAYYLHDGNHRATAALLLGQRTIRARVVDFDSP